LQRIFDGHVKSLKILKEFIPEASLQTDRWTGFYCFRSLRAYCSPHSLSIVIPGEAQHRPGIRGEMFQILYSSRSLIWSPDQVSDDKNIFS